MDEGGGGGVSKVEDDKGERWKGRDKEIRREGKTHGEKEGNRT